MGRISKKTFIGYTAGIVTGVTYGLNPLFAVPLMHGGATVEGILLMRYLVAVAFLGIFLLIKGESFRVTGRQLVILLLLGVLFACSSLFLFEAYNYIASGLATTLVFLYPVLVALIMLFLGVKPSWQVWVAIGVTFTGVTVMTRGGGGGNAAFTGILFSVTSALVYALFIVIINRSVSIRRLSNSLLTFYALATGAVMFLAKGLMSGAPLLAGLDTPVSWLNIAGLALFPTVISTATLALATRDIGAAKASVLGVFEPITAIAVGTLALGETLSANIIVGIVISVAAVTFMIATSKEKG